DPFRSTEAAAQLLAYNHRGLGPWPPALTAYTHGTAGVRRAKETLGTDDIVRIVRSYNSRTFGFASRNFYVSFLAALEVDRNPEKYFGSLQRQSALKFQEVQLPAYVSMPTLERALRIEPEKLRALNPALTHAVWDGRQRVPKAYRLRLPLDGTSWTRELLAQRLSPGEMFAGQSAPRHPRRRLRPPRVRRLRRLPRLRSLRRLRPMHRFSRSASGRHQPAARSPPKSRNARAPRMRPSRQPRGRARLRSAPSRCRRRRPRRSVLRSGRRSTPSRTPIPSTTASRTTKAFA